jgi:hypothetical protein
MILNAFTLFHVVLSLAGIGSALSSCTDSSYQDGSKAGPRSF